MADDIVTRLRKSPKIYARMYGSVLNPDYDRCQDAAKEIELLRSELRQVWELMDSVGECWNPHECELCQTKAKAVRGES